MGNEVLRNSDLSCLRNTQEATVQCLFLFSLTFHPPSVVTGLAGAEWTVALVRGLLHAPGVCVGGCMCVWDAEEGSLQETRTVFLHV